MLERNLGEHRQENIVGASDDETIPDDAVLVPPVRSTLIPRHSVAIQWSTDQAQESSRFHVRHCSEPERVNEDHTDLAKPVNYLLSPKHRNHQIQFVDI